MGLFKHQSTRKDGRYKVKITEADERRLKARSENIHDPILNAVNEAQPFEEAYSHQRNESSLSGEGGRLNDVFGNPIQNPDVSNPSRSRDERPLDTIRAFEYSITGDNAYRQQLETPQLGWKVRDDFPLFSSNPYGQNASSQQQQPQYDEYGRPVQGSSGMASEQAVYKAQPRKHEKKKKRGLFGRRKK